jgi:hypothetical protein
MVDIRIFGQFMSTKSPLMSTKATPGPIQAHPKPTSTYVPRVGFSKIGTRADPKTKNDPPSREAIQKRREPIQKLGKAFFGDWNQHARDSSRPGGGPV